MPNLHSELANWDGKLSNPPVQDQTSQSSINSRNRLVSYPQAKYSSSSQQRVQGETRTSTSKESSVQNLVDRKRIETAKPGFSEGSYLTELLSSPRPRDIKNVASVSVTFVTQGVDNPSAAVNEQPIPLSSIVESAVNEAVETATVSDVFERRSQNNVIHRPPPDTVSPANQSLQPDDTQLVKTFNFAHESANLPLHTPLSISVHNVQDDYSTTLEHTFNVAFNSNASVCDTPQSPRFSGFRAVTSMDRSRPTRQITSHGKPDAASKSIQPDSLDVPLLNISPSFESSRDNEMEELMVNDLLTTTLMMFRLVLVEAGNQPQLVHHQC
ncbi:hypothetical protein BJ138DRAFT_376115 [Hygrophoropsis aurantiaca]|uniref:Uncharacterized protein n=1 Tax=Hygrophoropsis aurantiaca TaxID=72124 RepID=A0ACB8A4W8_9AGAM|nr:hypothetical protein BJ138DRAFT_376115 [Hygrophoropsis aurantiaca]